jgi:hypothetical protein
LFGRQLPHLSFDGFELAHEDSVPLGAREVNAQTRTGDGVQRPELRRQKLRAKGRRF